MTRPARPGARIPAALALLLLAGACVAGGTRSASTSSFSDVVELEEIEASTASNAYDMVRQIRPQWLRGRGSTNLRGGEPVLPVVYVSGAREGSVEALRNIPTLALLRLRFVDAPTATMRYGEGHSGGVIEVTLRRR